MHSLLQSIQAYQPHQDYVLAIIIDTQGSTYRKSGALMLIDSTYHYWGLLSGGCLEGDIMAHCEMIFEKKVDKVVTYDMRGEDDLLWGMGLGCDGSIQVLLKHLPAYKNHLGFFEILNQVSQGHSHILKVKTQAPYLLEFTRDEKSSFIQNHTKTLIDKSQNLLSTQLPAPIHLLICGASPDVPPVASIAEQLGWKITIIDHRADYACSDLFCKTATVEHIKRSQWKNYDLTPFDAVVVMSHQFERDEDYLQRLLPSQINYIGLLGPAKRRDQLLKSCQTDFNQHQGRVFGPIGLNIGASTPETIALAIIAEIQAVRTQKDAVNCSQVNA